MMGRTGKNTLLENTHGQPTDVQLVESTLRNRQAYGAIVLRYQPILGRYVKRLLGRHASAVEDVLQEVFIKAYLNLNDYDRARNFAPWIYRIAHNETITHLRRRNTQPQTISGEDAEIILMHIADGDDPDAAWQRGRKKSEMNAALAALKPQYRDILVLRYLEEKSYDEISDILEIPPGTVATYLSRGLRQLQAGSNTRAQKND